MDTGVAVDNLIRRGVNILFTVGGDGTQRGAHDLYQEAQRRGHALSVVGVPKTIDNDVSFVSRTFGYLTAVEEACRVLESAHTEARSVPMGIGLVKLMGRHSGFITAGATVASQDVNFALIPEVPFSLQPVSRNALNRVVRRAACVSLPVRKRYTGGLTPLRSPDSFPGSAEYCSGLTGSLNCAGRPKKC